MWWLTTRDVADHYAMHYLIWTWNLGICNNYGPTVWSKNNYLQSDHACLHIKYKTKS